MAKEINEQPHAVADTLLGRTDVDGPAHPRRAAHRRGPAARHRQDRRHRLRHGVLRRAWSPSTRSSTGAASRPRSTWRTSSATATRWSTSAPWSWRSPSPARRWTRSWRCGTPASRVPRCSRSATRRARRSPASRDAVLYTHAGPEIAVASTKAFLAQITACYLLGLYLAALRGDAVPRRGRPDPAPAAGDAGQDPEGARRAGAGAPDGALDGRHALGAVPRPARRVTRWRWRVR